MERVSKKIPMHALLTGLSAALAAGPAVSEAAGCEVPGDLTATGTWDDPRLAAIVLGHSLEACRLNPDRIWNLRMQIHSSINNPA
jgi:hypothetical protein